MIAQQLKIFLIIAIMCLLHNVQGMEIWNVIKQGEKESLIRHHPKSTTDLSQFLKQSAGLPEDIKKIIGKMFLKLYLREHKLDDIQLEPLIVLNLLCRAQNMCPLTIGNKTFQWKDILRLKNEQQKKLYIMGNPPAWYTCLTGFDNNYIERSHNCCTRTVYCLPKYCCGAIAPDIQFLEDQPEHIKKNLVVQEVNYTFGCVVGGYCAGLAAISSMVIGIAHCNPSFTAFFPAVLASWFKWVPVALCSAGATAFPADRLFTKECSYCGCSAREKKFG